MVYDREKMAEQDERGALSRAQRVGREKGREEGRIEGMVALVLELVEPRFGTPEEAIVTRIRTATVEELGLWAGRISTAESLDEVLRDP